MQSLVVCKNPYMSSFLRGIIIAEQAIYDYDVSFYVTSNRSVADALFSIMSTKKSENAGLTKEWRNSLRILLSALKLAGKGRQKF